MCQIGASAVRKLLYPEDAVRRLFGKLRDEMQDMGERHLTEVLRLRTRIAVLEAEIENVRSTVRELRAARAAIVGAHDELVSLHREAAIQRAQRTERDDRPLN